MCGILGYSRSDRSTLSADQMKIILSILITRMDDRGGDSWGWFHDGEIKKGIGTGVHGINLDEIVSGRSLMLHTRKATVGDKTEANAHPWQINNLIGMHNGGVTNHPHLTWKYGRDYEVDSQHIFAHISEDKPLDELHAHGAIVYVDSSVSMARFWICRFNGGVLTVAAIGPDINNPTDTVFCSLGDPIKQALDMAKVPSAQAFKVEEGRLYYVESGDMHYTVPEIKLPFATSRNVGFSRSDYDPRCAYSSCDIPLPAALRIVPKSSPTRYKQSKSANDHHTIKQFVRIRTGLEAWYKSGDCSWCNLNTAQVRVPCTNLFYCIKCWEHLESLVGKMLTVEDWDILGVTDQAPPWEPVVQLDSSKTDEDKICDECQQEIPRYYSTTLDMVLCPWCAKERGFEKKELVDMWALDAISADMQPHKVDDDIPDVTRKIGSPCQCTDPKCDRTAAVWYTVTHAGNMHLHLSRECFVELHAIDNQLQQEQLASKRRKVIFRGHKKSAKNPDKPLPLSILKPGLGDPMTVH